MKTEELLPQTNKQTNNSIYKSFSTKKGVNFQSNYEADVKDFIDSLLLQILHSEQTEDIDIEKMQTMSNFQILTVIKMIELKQPQIVQLFSLIPDFVIPLESLQS